MKLLHPCGSARTLSVVPCLLIVAWGCAPTTPFDPAAPKKNEGPIITREHIAQSGATDAWEALRWGASHLNFQYTREGSPIRVTHRGVDSFYVDPTLLLVVDGTQMTGLESLRNIPANSVDYIQILSGRVGTLKYGTDAGNGVVVVKTGIPPARRP